MILTDDNRSEVYKRFVNKIGNEFTPISILKKDLVGVAGKIDDWLETVLSDMSSAVSEPAKSALPDDQKILLLKIILDLRLEAM